MALECFLCDENLLLTLDGEDEDTSPKAKPLKQLYSQSLIRLFGFLHQYGYSHSDDTKPRRARSQGKATTNSRLLQSLQERLQLTNYCTICTAKVNQVVETFKLYDNLGQQLEAQKEEMLEQLSSCSPSAVATQNSVLRREFIREFCSAIFTPVPAPPKDESSPAAAAGCADNHNRRLAINNSQPVVKLRRLDDDPSTRASYSDCNKANFHLNQFIIKQEPEDVDFDALLGDMSPDLDLDDDSDADYELPSPSPSSKRRKRVKKGKSKDLISKNLTNKRPDKPLRRSFKPKPNFPCDFEGCDFLARGEAVTQKHLQTAHPEVPRLHVCAELGCGASFIREERLARHKHWLHSGRERACHLGDCNYATDLRASFELHLIRAHKIGGEPCPYADTTGCTYVGPSWGVRKHLRSRIHEDQGHVPLKHMCHHCGKTFICPDKLRHHLTARHPELVSDPSELERYRCKECGKVLCTPWALRSHIQAVHLRQFDVHCEVCGKGVRHMAELRSHKRSHLKPEEFEFACKVCHAKFRQQSGLAIHMRRRHTGEGDMKFSSAQCDKKFIKSANLGRHEKIHVGVLNHVCHICNKGFPVLDYLRTHLKKQHATPEEKKAQSDRQRQQQQKKKAPVPCAESHVLAIGSS